jgi:hypothetical protein
MYIVRCYYQCCSVYIHELLAFIALVCDGSWHNRVELLFDIFKGFGSSSMSYEDIIVASNIAASSLLKFWGEVNLIDGELNMLCEALADDAYTKVCATVNVVMIVPVSTVQYIVNDIALLCNCTCFVDCVVCRVLSFLSCRKNWSSTVPKKMFASGSKKGSRSPRTSLRPNRCCSCIDLSIDRFD